MDRGIVLAMDDIYREHSLHQRPPVKHGYLSKKVADIMNLQSFHPCRTGNAIWLYLGGTKMGLPRARQFWIDNFMRRSISNVILYDDEIIFHNDPTVLEGIRFGAHTWHTGCPSCGSRDIIRVSKCVGCGEMRKR